MKAQIVDGISGGHLYFDIRHNCDGRVISCTREERKLRVFENRVLRKIFGPRSSK